MRGMSAYRGNISTVQIVREVLGMLSEKNNSCDWVCGAWFRVLVLFMCMYFIPAVK